MKTYKLIGTDEQTYVCREHTGKGPEGVNPSGPFAWEEVALKRDNIQEQLRRTTSGFLNREAFQSRSIEK